MMPFADNSSRRRKVSQNDRNAPHVPMGDHRFQQLMNELGAAFAQVDDGEEKRRQIKERERQHDLWMAQREATIAEIVSTLRRHGLSVEDLA